MNQYNKAESVQLIFSGNDFFKCLKKMIDAAEEIIHIQIYIFEHDKTGSSILESLYKAVERGVKVFVLADAYGSKSLSKKKIKHIRNSGVNFRLFSPFFSSESIYMGRRLHHKIIVVDKMTALVGGINIADKYHGTEKEEAWLDYAVLIKGNICNKLHTLCEQLFAKRTRIRNHSGNGPDDFNGNIPIRFSRNDWVRGKNEIHKSYLQALKTSERSVIFIASYFLPGYKFRKALKNARKRGVEITIILAGKSDMPILWYAEKYLYLFYLKNGIKIYEWKNSIMHAKAAIADKNWVTIGSYNLNPVSRYRSIELNVVIKDKSFAKQFLNHITMIKENNCSRIILNTGSLGPLLSRIRNSVLYYFFKLIFRIFINKTNGND